jgi:uncharacterized protein involved in exopolysaccharide biosynthesis
MRRYLQAYFRHPILLTAPLIIALIVSIYYGLHQPRKYQAGASIWCDVPVPSESTIFTGTTQPPSAAQAAVLTEMLQTHEFLMNVGKRGPWADYLATHDQATDDRLVQQLGAKVVVATPGPHVMTIATSGSSAADALALAKAVTAAYIGEVTDASHSRAQSLVGYYQQQLDATQKALAGAQQKLSKYLQANPASAVIGGAVVDPTVAELTQAVAAAQKTYSDATASYTSAGLGLTNLADAGVLRVIDQPREPTSPLSHKKQLIFAGVGGLFAGGAISLLAIIMLVVSDDSVRGAADIEDALQLQVVGAIGQVKMKRHGRGAS